MSAATHKRPVIIGVTGDPAAGKPPFRAQFSIL